MNKLNKGDLFKKNGNVFKIVEQRNQESYMDFNTVTYPVMQVSPAGSAGVLGVAIFIIFMLLTIGLWYATKKKGVLIAGGLLGALAGAMIGYMAYRVEVMKIHEETIKKL